jgi:hypothetical protein
MDHWLAEHWLAIVLVTITGFAIRYVYRKRKKWLFKP